jgi:WD40 repeat protein
MSVLRRLATLCAIPLLLALAPGPRERPPRTIKCEGHTAFVGSVAVSPDRKLIASGSDDRTLRFWSAPDGKAIRTVKAVPEAVRSGLVGAVTFSPDGKTLHTGGNDPEVKLWDRATGKPAGTLEGHTDQVADLALSKDGRVLVSAGRDRRVLIWHLDGKGR